MSVTAEVPLTFARTLLNDDDAIKWPDYRIMPKLQQAFKEIVTDFIINEIPVTIDVTGTILVPAGTTDLSTCTGYPTDIVVPIWMKENQIGGNADSWCDMLPRDFIPQVMQDIKLYYWCWQDQTIKLLGAINDVNVMLRYRKNITGPTLNTDIIEIDQIDDYLAYRTAALCYYSIANIQMGDKYASFAADRLDNTIRVGVKQVGTLSAKRRPYHRRYGNSTNNVGFW